MKAAIIFYLYLTRNKQLHIISKLLKFLLNKYLTLYSPENSQGLMFVLSSFLLDQRDHVHGGQ